MQWSYLIAIFLQFMEHCRWRSMKDLTPKNLFEQKNSAYYVCIALVHAS